MRALAGFLSVLLAFLSASVLLSQSLEIPNLPNEYHQVFESILSLEADASKVATVNNLLLTKDVGAFVLESGELYLCKPIRGRRYAAVFVGKGIFQYTPATRVEQDHLERFEGKKQMYEEFSSLVFFCGDSTLEELQQDWTFDSKAVSSDVPEAIAEALEMISERDAGYIDPSLVRPLLNNEFLPLFYAHIGRKRNDPYFFTIDPYEETGEEVQFLKYRSELGYKYRRPVNQFHTQEEYTAGRTYANDGHPMLKITDYVIDTRLEGGREMIAANDVSFEMIEADKQWVNFSLHPSLKVDSVIWEDGTPAEFSDPGGSPFWVRLRDGLQSVGESGRITVYYHGEYIDREQNWLVLKSSIQWYPQHGYKGTATFDLTYHVPEDFRFVSIGKKQSEEREGKMVTTRWKTDGPVRNASFNIGFFDEHTEEPDGLPPVVIWIGRYSHSGFGADIEKQVGDDVVESIKLYSKLYGDYQADKIYVTEILQPHGEAFPGLIHISWSTFESTTGFDHRFRAHEVAHQWWGASGVDFGTYHDQWLSEGFSDYSSLMFLQARVKGNDLFLKTLRDWRNDVFRNKEAGPISLGYRLGSAYDVVVYKKGAWVLHMLRNMMIDLKTMKEDRFVDMMRDFFQTYNGSTATTADFQAMVEKHMDGADLNWFFDQWVYGTDLPTYSFDYSVRKGEGDSYIATVDVQQKGVSPSFEMYVPIKIDFGKHGISRLRVKISGSGGTFDLPPLPYEPEEIIFNENESVLCKID